MRKIVTNSSITHFAHRGAVQFIRLPVTKYRKRRRYLWHQND